MNESDKVRFGMVVNAMASSYRIEPTKAMLHGYWLGLQDLPVEAVEQAAVRSLKESRFMPTPAELRERAGAMSLSDRSFKAWDAVQKAVEKHGCYRSVRFDDPIVNATIRNLGGWMNLDERMKGDGRRWTRKEFLATYQSFCQIGISPEAGNALIGFTEHDHRRYHRNGELSEIKLIECGLPPHGPGVVPALSAPTKRNDAPKQLVADAVAGIGQMPKYSGVTK